MTKNQAGQDPARGVDSRGSHNRSAVLTPTRTGDMTEPDPPRVLQVRPTLRALKLLPTDEPAVAAERTVFDRAKSAPDVDTKRAILAEHRLWQLQYSLLNDVRTILEQEGMPDRHTPSKAAGRTVYEARGRTGAAWRGASVLEGDVLWLVYASPHDRFHSTAADFIKKGKWLPRRTRQGTSGSGCRAHPPAQLARRCPDGDPRCVARGHRRAATCRIQAG